MQERAGPTDALRWARPARLARTPPAGMWTPRRTYNSAQDLLRRSLAKGFRSTWCGLSDLIILYTSAYSLGRDDSYIPFLFLVEQCVGSRYHHTPQSGGILL